MSGWLLAYQTDKGICTYKFRVKFQDLCMQMCALIRVCHRKAISELGAGPILQRFQLCLTPRQKGHLFFHTKIKVHMFKMF